MANCEVGWPPSKRSRYTSEFAGLVLIIFNSRGRVAEAACETILPATQHHGIVVRVIFRGDGAAITASFVAYCDSSLFSSSVSEFWARTGKLGASEVNGIETNSAKAAARDIER